MALAPQVTNVGTQGQNARYDTRNTWRLPNGLYTDGTYTYREQGPSVLAENRPDQFVSGLGAANNNGPGGVGAGSGGGGNDLYSAAVGSPWYQQALAAVTAQNAASAASRKSGIQQALIQFGLVPEGFNDQYGDVDATTRSLADANTTSGISLYARLKQSLADAQRDSSRRLAARGLRRSGTRGYQMRRNQLGYDQSYSDSVAKLLGGVNSLYGNYANSAYSGQMTLAQMLANSINNMSGFVGGFGSTSSASPAASPWAAHQSAGPAWQPGELAQVSQETGISQGTLGRGRGGEGFDW